MLIHDKKTDVFHNRFEGRGEIIMEHVIDEKLYGGKIPAFAQVQLKPGCSLGWHIHKGTSETYYILEGTAVYNDNGSIVTLKAGDTSFCPDGEGHAIANGGDDDLVFMALIVNS